jgi:hypothetical protein
MIVKVRVPVPCTDEYRWTIFDHVDRVELLTGTIHIMDAEEPKNTDDHTESGLNLLGTGPDYMSMNLTIKNVVQPVAFSGIAFICTDDGKTLETIGG